MDYVFEPSKEIKVCADVDVCVIGGSCTGVFAAVRAARLGARVAIVEKQNCFGGVATNGLVNIWHSLHDIDDKNQIIAGLTYEMIERLNRVEGVETNVNSRNSHYTLNTEELKIELDTLILENKIQPFLHTFYSSVTTEEKGVTSVIVENKDGRRAIKARFFIDATGDGDIARDLNIKSYRHSRIQPPTYCFYLQGDTGSNLADIIKNHGAEVGVDDEWGWSSKMVNSDLTMRADNRIFNRICNNAKDLTFAEIEGRKKVRGFISLLKKYGDSSQKYNIISSCSQIGIRETVHYETNFQASEMDLLCGVQYEDAILNGTYRVDIHHSEDNGITFKDLTGEWYTYYGRNGKRLEGNWRKDLNITGDYAKYYQLPFAAIVNDDYKNFIPVGRMLNADKGAFGALRVMVNLNQIGEAAGVAAYMALDGNVLLQQIKGKALRENLRKGGSAL